MRKIKVHCYALENFKDDLLHGIETIREQMDADGVREEDVIGIQIGENGPTSISGSGRNGGSRVSKTAVWVFHWSGSQD